MGQRYAILFKCLQYKHEILSINSLKILIYRNFDISTPRTGRTVSEIKEINGRVKNFSQKCVIIKILHLYLQRDFNINTLTK